jgi:hypothetical protein
MNLWVPEPIPGLENLSWESMNRLFGHHLYYIMDNFIHVWSGSAQYITMNG